MRKGFTLAEVLITLGIIGVVAAMTIPSLITKYQKKAIETKFKEDFSIIQQVIRSNTANDTEIDMAVKDFDTNYLKTFFDTYFAPYMKYSHVCYDKEGCWQNRGSNKTLTGQSCLYDRKGIGIGLNIITIKMYNGTNICIDAFQGINQMKTIFGINTSGRGLSIYIDANGDSGPNVIGKDIYILTYTPEYGIVPAGYHKSLNEINQNCSRNATGMYAGYFCLMRIKNNGWQILDEVWDLKI